MLNPMQQIEVTEDEGQWGENPRHREDELCTILMVYSLVKGCLNRAVQCYHCNGNIAKDIQFIIIKDN